MSLRGWLAHVRQSNGIHPRRREMPVTQHMVPSTILDLLDEGVLWVDERGHIVLSNGAARQFLGLQDGAAPAQPLWELTRQPLFQEVVTRGLRNAAHRPFEISIFTPEERVLQGRAWRHHAEPRCVLILRDVTALRHLERVRQDFVANVSHELRTPLTSIKGFIETLLDGAIDDPQHNRPFLRLVEQDVNRLVRLTNDLLELSRAESLGKPKSLQAVELVNLIQEIIATLAPQIKAKRLSVTVDQLSLVPSAKGDPDQLRQVFWNLLENAVKYNMEGGTITVRVRYHKTFLYVEVVDSGIGIPAEELPRIFERFYRVDKARSRALGGTGLGLAIVNHIVDAHEGQVNVSSEPGHGSTFRVTLPIWHTPSI